jgi:hypothetical protein
VFAFVSVNLALPLLPIPHQGAVNGNTPLEKQRESTKATADKLSSGLTLEESKMG